MHGDLKDENCFFLGQFGGSLHVVFLDVAMSFVGKEQIPLIFPFKLRCWMIC